MLGLSTRGNNWKLVVGNFLTVFLIQFVFALNDVIQTGRYPEIFEVVMMASSSLVTTLIFAGYNRIKESKGD